MRGRNVLCRISRRRRRGKIRTCYLSWSLHVPRNENRGREEINFSIETPCVTAYHQSAEGEKEETDKRLGLNLTCLELKSCNNSHLDCIYAIAP